MKGRREGGREGGREGNGGREREGGKWRREREGGHARTHAHTHAWQADHVGVLQPVILHPLDEHVMIQQLLYYHIIA